MNRTQEAGQNNNTKIADKSFEYVQKVKYFGTTLVDQNILYESIKIDEIQEMSANNKSRILALVFITISEVSPTNMQSTHNTFLS